MKIIPVLLLGTFTCRTFSGTTYAASLSGLPVSASQAQPSGTSADQARYIRDVEGNTVRLVGRRFYTNPEKALDFPGRDETRLMMER